MRHAWLVWLAMVAAALLCSANASAAEEQQQGQSTGTVVHGTVTTAVTAFNVSGDEHKFQEVNQRPDDFQFGLENFSVHMPEKGWSLDAHGALLDPGYYKLNLQLKKPDLGFVAFDFYQFDTYDDGSLPFYPFAPFVYQRGGDVIDARRNMGVTFGWTPQDGPKVTLRLEQWRLDGDRVLYRGGQVTDGTTTLNNFPLIEHQDQTRNRAILGVEQDVGDWHYRISQMYENFDGTNNVNEFRFDSAGALDQKRKEKYSPDFHDWTTTLDAYGDLIKDVLRLDFTGEYVTLDTTSNYDENAFDSSGNLTGASHANNFLGNKHNGDLQRLLGNVRLTFTPNDVWTVWGGIGYKKEDDNNHSVLNDEDVATQTISDTTVSHNTRDRDVMMYDLGARVRPLDWLMADVEGRWERGDVHYHWRSMETFGGSGSTLWIADEDSDRNDYTASVTARPLSNLKLIGRVKHSKIDGDYTNIADLEDGDPAPDSFPGLIGDYDRIMNELSTVAQYRALSNLYLAYKFIRRTEEFRVLSLPDPNTGNQHSIINSLSVTYTPCDRLSLSGYGAVSNYKVRTQARHNATVAVPRYDGDSRTLGLDASLTLDEKTALSGGVAYTKAESLVDSNYADIYVGLNRKLSKVWSLNCRYMYSKYNESDNGGINDYHANGVTLGLTGSF